MTEVIGVILAGGRGTRLHPVTAGGTPKALVPLFGDSTLLSMTHDRLARVTDRQMVVVHGSTAAQYREQGPQLDQLVEPLRRDTGPAVAHAATTVAAADPDATVVITPVDHLAGPRFTDALGQAVTAAHQHGAVVLVGVTPTRAATGYGYIQPEPSDDGGLTPVTSFHEKPDAQTAEALIARGALWNTGVVVAPVRTLQATIQDSQLAEFATAVRSAPAEAYREVAAVSFDVAVLEDRDDLWVLPVAAEWDDVGSWDAFSRAPARARLQAPGGAEPHAAEGVTVVSDGPTVSAVGVEDLVIVAWGDEVLVVAPEAAQEVRRLADR
ncbi:MAG: sugar phosphate nucleotidyltransferase [Haloferacaceae archaeon]|nr:sugar phosphate nucleotidyltransferase [Haloferacaceae archaeon]